MDSRLADHLLRRLRRHAEMDAIDFAIERGILVEHLRTVAGRKVRIFAPGPVATGKTPTEIARILRRHASIEPPASDEWDDVFNVVVGGIRRDGGGAEGFPVEVGQGTSEPVPDLENLLRVVRQSAEPPPAVTVATLLLVAQSITMSAACLDDVVEALRVASPIVTITGRVKGFEEAFLDLLGKGFILPGPVARCKGYELARHYGFRFSNTSEPRWRVIVFNGDGFDADTPETTQGQIGIAAESVYPILGIAESADLLPWQLKQAARINLICGPLNMGIIRRSIRAVLGNAPKGKISLQ